jgi:hypothetical protein
MCENILNLDAKIAQNTVIIFFNATGGGGIFGIHHVCGKRILSTFILKVLLFPRLQLIKVNHLKSSQSLIR